MEVENKLKAMGLELPAAGTPSPGRAGAVKVGNLLFVGGHTPGANFRGKLGADITIEQGYEAARQTGLAILSSLKREFGTLNNITAWLRAFGMVNVAPGFVQTPPVINGFSDLIIDVFGPEIGNHSRSAVGMAELPFGAPVEIEAEVEISL